MPESGFAGAAYSVSISPGAAVTYYGNYGNSAGAALGTNTNEEEVELVHQGSDVTLKDLRVVVTTNGRAANSTVTTRKNTADTSQVVTITASTTGTYVDTTNTVSFTAGDKQAYKLAIGSTSGAFTAASITVNTESAGQSFNFWSSIGAVSFTNSNTTRYYPLTGSLPTTSATVANFQGAVPVAGAFYNLRCYVTSARSTDTEFSFNKNGTIGSQSVTILASTTGAYEEDTSTNDSVAIGDLVCAQAVTPSGGSGTLTITCVSARFIPSTAEATAIISGPVATLGASQTRFYTPIGQLTANTTEAVSQQIAPFAGVASYATVTVSANASTTNATLVLRKNGSSTAVSVSITNLTTGTFNDISNSVSVAATDLLAYQGSGADGSITLRQLSLRYVASAPAPGGASNFFMFFG